MRAKLAWAYLAAAVAAALPGPAAAQERTPTAISDIRQESNERSTRLTVECSGPLAYTYYSPDPLTLVVDIPEMDASKVPSRINVGSREVESIRVTSMARADGRSLARLEVRLASLAPYQIYSKGKELTLIFERPAALAKAETPDPGKTSEPQVYVPVKPRALAPEAKPTPEAARVAEVAPAAPTPAPVKEPKTTPQPALERKPTASAPKASKILGVSSGSEEGRLAVTVKADGTLRHQDFFLGNPSRLVVDFPEVTSAAQMRTVEVGTEPVLKARIAQFSVTPSRVARLVLDLSSKAPYQIVDRADGLKIVFGEGTTPAPSALAAMRSPEPAPAPEPQIMPAPAPAPVLPMPMLPEPQIAPMSSGPLAAQEIGPATGAKKYTGPPISLDFKDGDLQDIFRLFADISGLNVVVNPGVSGKVTLKLNEVPWDQALDLILKTNGLGYTLEDNVIRIARLSDLQREEQEKRKLAEEKALAGDLITQRKRLSYAKATNLEATIKKVSLSPRGSITLDERTNTMIITDLDSFLSKALDLIADLDRATPQVEIEARIVVTTRSFVRQLGIQWGFLNQNTPQFGNATGLSFPNSIILNGSGLGTLSPGGQQVLTTDAGLGGSHNRGYAVNLPAGSANTALGLSMGNVLGSFSLDAALTALETQGRGRILSTPRITTQNNQQAEIKQGIQLPYQSQANNTVQVQFKDATLTLKVTPQITDAGTVILALDVQNDTPDFSRQVGTGVANSSVPPINTQSAKTTVLVKDGATAVIGGIYQSTEDNSRGKTPFLGNIPILGYLFRNSSVRSENAELLLFITPRIVKS